MADGQVLYRIVIDDSNVDSDIRQSERKIDNGMDNVKKKAGATAKVLGGALVTGLVGVGVASIKSADDMDKAMNGFIASTGKSIDEVERYQGVLESIYTNNYGESFEDIADKMALVNQQMGDLSDEELKNITEKAYLLEDTFGIGFSESIRGVNSLVKQFGITSEDAFELLAQGAQSGLNQNEDLADQLAEYSTYYADLGFSAESAFDTMLQGSKDGAFQLDYINDAIKEFGIRSKDMSKSSAQAFTDLGLDADKYFESFAKGGETANEAFGEVASALTQIKDPLKKNEIGVALFGTKFEDLGESAVDAMLGLSSQFDVTKNKLEEMENIKYGSTAEMFEGLKRSLEPLLIDLGQQLIPILVEVVNALMPIVQNLLPLFSSVLMQLAPLLGELINALLPVLVELFEMLLPPVMQIITMLFPVLIELINALLPIVSTLLELLSPILNLIIALLEPILNLISEGITPLIEILGTLVNSYIKSLINNFEILSSVITSVFDVVVGYLTGQVQKITDIFSNLIDFIKNVFTGNWQGAWDNVKNIFGTTFEGIKSSFKLPFNVIIGGVNGFLGGLDGIKIPDWVPKIGGKGFSFPFRIPKLAKGGLAFDDTMAIVGDNPNASVDPEVIAPLSKLEAMLGISAMGNTSNTVYNSVVVTGNTIADDNINTIGDDFMRKLKRDGLY